MRIECVLQAGLSVARVQTELRRVHPNANASHQPLEVDFGQHVRALVAAQVTWCVKRLNVHDGPQLSASAHWLMQCENFRLNGKSRSLKVKAKTSTFDMLNVDAGRTL